MLLIVVLIAALASGCVPKVVSESIDIPSWEIAAPMPTPRGEAWAVAVNGKIYVIGGGDGAAVLGTVEEYDIATDTWTNCGGGCAPKTTPSVQLVVGALGGKIYAFGGFTVGDGSAATAAVEVFDPAANSWINTCNGDPCDDMIAVSQEAQSSVVLLGSKLWLFGGGNLSYQADVTSFDPTAGSGNMWTPCNSPCQDLPYPVSRMTSIAIGNKVYVLGGFSGGLIGTLSRYDVPTTTWDSCGGGGCASAPVVGMDAALGYSNGVLYAFGTTDNNPSSIGMAYSIGANAWRSCGGTCSPIPTPVGGYAWVQVGNRVHLIGGSDGISTIGLHQVAVLP
ncbi:MAG TPA: kelch repeat-containing protein [bacterium]